MAKYLFTSDQRIATLPEKIKWVADYLQSGKDISNITDKSDNNNASTLRFYYNLYPNTEVCRNAVDDPKIAIRNFVLKFQFPNTRTIDSFNDSLEEKTLLAPFRVIVSLLFYMAKSNETKSSYISLPEILYFIFCDSNIYTNPQINYTKLIERIKQVRLNQINLEPKIEKIIQWNQYGRQSRELIKVLTYAISSIKLHKNNLSFDMNSLSYEDDKLFINQMINYNRFWFPTNRKDFSLSNKEYISYMDTSNTPYNIIDFKDINDINNPNVDIVQSSFSISEIIKQIEETGLLYSKTLIKRFAFSLMAKRFLILSGLAGSGKTQLALAFANMLIEDKKQLCVVTVGADWSNREPLLGFPNALKENKYEKPESGVLDLLIEANKTENKDKPYFLILDEMNMSYVERYFADFLSVMESGESISLWNNDAVVPTSISLPDNLFIIGTINVDETTYMFSPKVLDRANVIEFKISPNEMEEFLNKMRCVDRSCINRKAASMGKSFVKLASIKEFNTNDSVIKLYKNSS